MNNLSELLDTLENKEILLSTDGIKLDISAPKNTLTHELINEIKSNKQNLIDFLNNEYIPDNNLLEYKLKNALHECSYSQKAHFLRYKFSNYWVPQNLCLTYDFNYYNNESFIDFVDILLERHEALKTTYVLNQGNVFQKINPLQASSLQMELYENKDAIISKEDLYLTELNRKIDLEIGPLFNIAITEIESSIWRLFLTIDMSIIEGSSQIILNKEIPLLYESAHLKTIHGLTPVLMQYKDFGLLEHTRISSLQGRTMKSFWKNYFTEATKPLLFSTDYPYLEKKSGSYTYSSALEHELTSFGTNESIEYKEHISGIRSSFKFYPGAMIQFILGQNQLTAIHKIKDEIGISSNIFFLTTFYLLFYKLTHTKNILIGNCISLRDDDKLEHTVGFFTNIIFPKIQIDPSVSFQELAITIGMEFIKCYEHKNYPWEKVLEDNNIPYDHVSHMFLDYLNLTNKKYNGPEIDNMAFTEGVPCIFENNCIINEYSDCAIFHWIYSIELFKKNSFVEIIQLHETIINKALSNPLQKIEDIIDVKIDVLI